MERERELTVIINHPFYIKHNLCIASMGELSHLLYSMTSCLEHACRLRVQHERYGKEAFDPF